ncbi:MAG: amphi-Trp domain-containing protein [Aridibacter sp.]|jgi:amphi-Trp domain-containing protein|nr:amphi-Trp domain-containing protein [Acidobacteriota bacterium]
MSEINREADVEKEYSKSEVVRKLRRLADALENEETFQIQIDKNKIEVPPDAVIEFEYESEGSDAEIEIEIKWKKK